LFLPLNTRPKPACSGNAAFSQLASELLFDKRARASEGITKTTGFRGNSRFIPFSGAALHRPTVNRDRAAGLGIIVQNW
jgi:hypothetical protein